MSRSRDRNPGATGGAAQAATKSKRDRTPDQWRAAFRRVYERDQCYPGAIFAALVSAEYLFGAAPPGGYDMPILNRKLGYHRGAAAPIDAPMLTRFRRWVESGGLEVRQDQRSSGAIERLERLTRADQSSFPVVGVDLRMVSEYDPRTRVRHVGQDQASPATDHALVILDVGKEAVSFFDPTFSRRSGTLIEEKIASPAFLRHWGGNQVAPYDTVWFEHRGRPTRRGKAHAPLNLYSYEKQRRARRP